MDLELLECASPSLQPTAKTCYEAKFLASEETVHRLEEVVADRLTLDPHVDLGERSYEVETLYFDTPTFSVFHKTAGFRTTKHRIRRYGLSENAFLERKTKSGGRVRKRRIPVALAELNRSLQDPSPGSEWFANRIVAKSLAPVCRIAYERTAYFGEGDTGPMRITFDRRLRASSASGLDWNSDLRAVPLPIAGIIVELKFTESMPVLFKNAVQTFGLTTTTASKYRAAVETLRLGVVGDLRHA